MSDLPYPSALSVSIDLDLQQLLTRPEFRLVHALWQ
jgi:hypothetical protein